MTYKCRSCKVVSKSRKELTWRNDLAGFVCKDCLPKLPKDIASAYIALKENIHQEDFLEDLLNIVRQMKNAAGITTERKENIIKGLTEIHKEEKVLHKTLKDIKKEVEKKIDHKAYLKLKAEEKFEEKIMPMERIYSYKDLSTGQEHRCRNR